MDKLNGLLAVNFGSVAPPDAVSQFAGGGVGGVPALLNVIFKTLVYIAALMTIINLIMAGYWFISASGDPKRIHDAWSKIWQSILGLAVAGGAFIVAGLVGRILFGDANAILQFGVYTPN